jgi:hypothetical protein
LCNALRAECDRHIETEAGDHLLDERSDSRVHGATEDQELPVPEVLAAGGQGIRNRIGVWIEVFVDRRSNDDNDVACSCDDGCVGRSGEASLGNCLAKHGLGSGLAERHDAGVDGGHSLFADVVDNDLRSSLGERDGERQADVSPAANNDDVVLEIDRHMFPQTG